MNADFFGGDSSNSPVPASSKSDKKNKKNNKTQGRRRSELTFLCKMMGTSGGEEKNGFQRKCQPRCQSAKRKTFPVWHFQLEERGGGAVVGPG